MSRDWLRRFEDQISALTGIVFCLCFSVITLILTAFFICWMIWELF